MSVDVETTPLMRYLENGDLVYYGRVRELRSVVTLWLSYVPQSFPHYTLHTVQHSDEIIRQISKLLFEDGDHHRPVVPLSRVEVYIIIAAAYLHDVGMVTSDDEKARILASVDWKSWTAEGGGGAKRWQDVAALRVSTAIADVAIRHFLADVQARFLIAELIRRTHPERASYILRHNHDAFAQCALGDPILLRTIADVCLAHGLRSHELEDHERYPDRRDIRGEQANVRFLAILLRLGDLLDMSYDRACPLLLNAASPLPADSLAHWMQYGAITHRLTAHDRIELLTHPT